MKQTIIRISRAALLLALAAPARAQIAHEGPARVKAANRRALRETRNADLPYKESHLALTPDRLRRGESVQPRTKTNRELDYKTGTAPNVKPVGLLGRRKKNL